MKTMHLICNAHLDPVWLWEWEEGAAEAISTFRAAADFCEEFDGFVFNHNEVILYRWVEEYELALFERIQRLVAQGKWHIMGGWYLQPDCNMPCGESFVRQILAGRIYFREKFGVTPRTAINFDPFGHNRGLVQILRKSGYDSYLFCRPFQNDCPLPSDDFTWVGFDGSEITGHRASNFYNQPLGEAREKAEKWIAANPEKDVGLVLWGVGNHGGGPSRVDLDRLAELMSTSDGRRIIHSSPEHYFDELRERCPNLPKHADDINPWGPGCYTSQVRIKQRHRLLENALYSLEKMVTSAALQGLLEYPKAELNEAIRDLLFSEFHDILPGSSIQPVEDAALRLMDHGLEILSRIRARAFFALAQGQPKVADGQIPILVYNPHPFPVCTVVECEFQLPDAKWGEQFTVPIVHQDGKPIPCQNEQEMSNLNLDWRKHAVFVADLAPSQMNRFDCALEVFHARPKPTLSAKDGLITIKTPSIEALVNCETGLVDTLAVDGFDYLKPNAFKLLAIADNEDPWETRYQSFREVAGAFELMSAEESTRFSGVTQGTLDAVRVIEGGDVRTVVEAMFRYRDSFAIIHYKFPKSGTEVELVLRVHWNEKSTMLKLSVPTVFEEASCLGQVAFGVQEFPATGRENVAQKWLAVSSGADDRALTCINSGTYGSDFADGELRLSLLRSAAYSGHPIGERSIVPQDRYTPRIDQGERIFRFWINAGAMSDRMELIDREALIHNEAPFAMSFCPSGAGEKPQPGITLSDSAVQLVAFKQAEASSDYIARLFEPTGRPRSTEVTIPALDLTWGVALSPFELKTYRIDPTTNSVREVTLMEE